MSPAILLQYILPHRLLSRIVFHATRWTFRPWKNLLIRQIVRRFNIDLSEAAETDPDSYPHFNAFFTRALRPGARSFDAAPDALLCPADGRIFQAKGQDFSAVELLGDASAAEPYADGSFMTVYLSPRDYHRVHMPAAGTLVSTLHIPGRLFSVAPRPVAAIPRLFARNERLVCHFESEAGPVVEVMVGALLVSSVSTVWSGLEVPPYAHSPHSTDLRQRAIRLARGEELGRFNMGSTVIVLLPAKGNTLDSDLEAEQAVRVGQPVGTRRS